MKTNAEIRFAAHPHDVKHWDSERLRKEHLIQDLFVENKVKMVYSLYDRMISGGAMPAGESLKLESIDEIKAPYFLHRREIGIYNVGGKGTVKVDDSTYTLEFKEALYIGSGDRKVIFESDDKSHPALFYFCSTPAHRNFPDKKITKSEAISVELGSLEASNHRVINKMIVNEVLETCQLQMGMTELKPEVFGIQCLHIHTPDAWRCISTLKYLMEIPYAISWASQRKQE